MTTLLRAISVLLLSLSLFGCNALKDKKTAEGEVATFHQRLDAEDYHAIYGSSSDDLKKAETEKGIAEYLGRVHTKLGKVRSTQETGFEASTGSDGPTMQLTYLTEFASGSAVEVFIYRVSGKDATLMSYRVESDSLGFK